MIRAPGAGTGLGGRHEHQVRLSGVEDHHVGIGAHLMVGGEPVLPGVTTVGGNEGAASSSDVDAVGVVWVDDRAVHVVVHPRNCLEGLACISALQQPALLNADE